MKKLVLFFALILNIIACKNSDVSPAAEETKIEQYITDKKLVVDEKTASGLRLIFVKKNPTGTALQSGQTIAVSYAGRLLDDKVFDSGSFRFVLGSGGVIKGFDEGVSKMKVGETATLIFPSSIGYGSKGSGSAIPGNSPLIFDIAVIGSF